MSSATPLRTFQPETLELLEAEKEVRIRTRRPDGSRVRTIVWIVVVHGRAYVRSWRGERGYWYQAAREYPNDVSVVVRGREIPVRAVHVTDEASIAECSSGLLAKYARSRSTPAMVDERVLGATLRLDPR